MKIKHGNTVSLLFTILDSYGVPITNLHSAIAIKFMVKVKQKDADADAKISKSLTNGIIIDSPAIGNIKVSLTAADTTILPDVYFMALQIEWLNSIQEVTIKDVGCTVEDNTLQITQDIIR